MPLDPGTFSLTLTLDYLGTQKIDNQDIMDCYFIEDIYSMCTFGKVSLHDRYGLKEYGPLTGDEVITLSYGNDALTTRVFTLYRIPTIEGTMDFQRATVPVVSLYFADSHFTTITLKRFSKSWPGTAKGSDIVQDICTNMIGLPSNMVKIEPSNGTMVNSFCMPQWSIAETIRWLSNRLVGTTGKYGYMFYTSSSDTSSWVNFATLDGLLKAGPKDTQTYLFDTSDMTYKNVIKAWATMGIDHIGVKEIGGGQLLGVDSSTKSFLGITPDESFIYSKAIKNITSLGGSSLFDGTSIDNDSTKFNYSYLLEGDADKTTLQNIFYNNFIRRYSLQNMVKVMVVGDPKRYAGMKITVMWPSTQASEIYSSMDSGPYLVKSVTHQFYPLQVPTYMQTLVLIKNAYDNSKTGDNTPSGGSTALGFSFGSP